MMHGNIRALQDAPAQTYQVICKNGKNIGKGLAEKHYRKWEQPVLKQHGYKPNHKVFTWPGRQSVPWKQSNSLQASLQTQKHEILPILAHRV